MHKRKTCMTEQKWSDVATLFGGHSEVGAEDLNMVTLMCKKANPQQGLNYLTAFVRVPCL